MTVWTDAFSGRSNISLQLTVTETVNQAANQSTINWSLKAVETASQPSFLYDPTATAFVTFTFDSANVPGQSLVVKDPPYDMSPTMNWEYDFTASGNQTKTIGSGSFIVNHGPDGRGQLLVYAGATDSQGNLGTAAIGSSSSRKTFTLTDYSISAVAATPTITRSGTDFVISRNSPTSSTGADQTFSTWVSKNGSAYVNVGSTTPITVSGISTDYAYAYIKSTFDGSTVQSSTVTIYGVPFAVSAPTISNVSTTSLTLSWTPPGINGSPIIYYVIEATTDDGNSWSVIESNVTQTYKNLTGLTIAATYKFRIIAISAVGPSPDGTVSVAQFISAYGYRFTNTSTTTPIVTAKIYVGIGGSGADENGYRSVQNIKKYTSGGWISLET